MKAVTFAVIGIFNTAIGLSSIYLFRIITENEVAANISGYCLALIISYFLNGKITFSSKVKSLRIFLKFLFAFFLSWLANIAFVLFFISQNFPPELSHLVGMPVYTIMFYLLSRFYVFINPEDCNQCKQTFRNGIKSTDLFSASLNEVYDMSLIKKYFFINQEVPWKVLVVFLIVHFLMLIYDGIHPEIFLQADRADYRWGVIQGFALALSKGSGTEFLVSNGLAGDYLFHYLLFFSIGKNGLIIFQVLLTLFSGYAVYGIARFLGLATSVAATANALYLVLPHTLILPHQLASDSIHCSLLIISLWLIAYFWDQQKEFSLAGSAITLGLATFVRPITLLWALVPAAVLFLRKRITNAILYLLLAFTPILIWMFFMLANTSHFTMGESSRNMGRNLYQRIWHITDTMDIASASHIREEILTQGRKGSISPQQYLRVMANYPGPFINYAIRDTLVFAFKSGIERITIDYFMIDNAQLTRKSLQGPGGWRDMLEKEGIVSTLMFLWKTQSFIFLISLVGAVLMAALTLLAFLGAIRMIIDRKRLNQLQRSMAIVLIALPFYIWFFSQIVPGVSSRHRAPAESAIVLLATYGAIWLLNSWSSFRMKNDGGLQNSVNN